MLGPAASLLEAQALLAAERPTVAVLDVNLGGEYVFPLVRRLREKDVPRLAKPVLPNALVGQLLRIVR